MYMRLVWSVNIHRFLKNIAGLANFCKDTEKPYNCLTSIIRNIFACSIHTICMLLNRQHANHDFSYFSYIFPSTWYTDLPKRITQPFVINTKLCNQFKVIFNSVRKGFNKEAKMIFELCFWFVFRCTRVRMTPELCSKVAQMPTTSLKSKPPKMST